MPDLRRLLEEHGYEDVRTLLQSGNVVLTSGEAPATLERDLERTIAEGLGVDTRVVVRTRDELADVIARDPFGDEAHEPKRYQVSFLSRAPDPEVVRAIAERDFTPEKVVFSGREAYAWHPAGMQRSALARLLTDERLGVTATARNWNTVTRLLELADEG